MLYSEKLKTLGEKITELIEEVSFVIVIPHTPESAKLFLIQNIYDNKNNNNN